MPTLQFKGKNTIWNHHLSIPYHTLDEVKNLNYKPEDGEGNLVIEGDNLIALKALMPMYRGSIKCIYIDPPYNTGKENWVYNDNVSNPLMKNWIGKVVGLDDLTRHDKWLMVPRLKLLRELLKDDGVIFISIDDNEVYNLREIMNEIFGEENYIALLPTIMNLKGNNDQYAFSGTHEYSLVFSKNKSKSKFYEFDIDEENIEEEWEIDNLGYFKKGSGLLAISEGKYREDRPYMYFPVLIKKNKISLISENEYKNIYNESTHEFDDALVDKIISKYKKLGYECILPIDQNGNKLRWTWGYEGKFIKDVDDIIITNTKNGISLNKKQRPSLS